MNKLGTNFTKEVQISHTENYKISLKAIKNIKEWKDTLYS